MIQKIGKRRLLFIAFACYLVFASFVMPWGAKQIEKKAGKKVEILDLQYKYSAAEARLNLDEYTTEARIFAADFNKVADSIYPLSYMFFMIVAMAFFFQIWEGKSIYRYRFVAFLPLLIGVFDYLENWNIQTVLRNYSQVSDEIIAQTSLFTQWKWNVTALTGLVLLTLLIAYFIRKRQLSGRV